MKTTVKMIVLLALCGITFACSKDDANQADSNCYECKGPNVETFDVCEEEGKIFVNGEEITD